jgi:Ca-activated chloride channel homolog
LLKGICSTASSGMLAALLRAFETTERRHAMTRTRTLAGWLLGLLIVTTATWSHAAGTLTPVGSPHQPIQIKDHQVNVVITNGFARTEVLQTFHNPNDTDLEAIYSFPVPKSASLSEVTLYLGEREIHGEVLEKEQARQVYKEEQQQGKDAGLATKNGYQTFEFAVARIRAASDVRIRFLYYQPLQIGTGIGRYVYPLEEGGTDEAAKQFWTRHDRVEGPLSVSVELTSSWPVADVRVPGFEADAKIQRLDTGHFKVSLDRQQAALDRDFVFYYRLQDDLPGRVELIAHRAAKDQPGTFMLVVTPGVDLKPITSGADYAFVLDVSGSMQGRKIQSQARAVARALGELRPADRFRIVAFASNARELTQGWTPATPANVAAAARTVEGLQAGGSTNLYEGVGLALKGLDDDRATSVLLVTDGVTNTGVVDPRSFEALVKQHDIRVFGFVIGNSANWPLVRLVAEASGGFYAAMSNEDDLLGQLLLARGKITSEALHDATLKISGVKVFDGTDGAIGKIYRGQQLVLFGRYERGGRATVTLQARITGEDKTYTTTFDFPEVDTRHPELERLWALERVETLEALQQLGRLPAAEAEQGIRRLGVGYQLVTDHTSMVVLADESFQARGIERRNRERVALERQAQAARAAQPAPSHRVDQAQPMFNQPAPSVGGQSRGGGAFDPLGAGLAVAMSAVVLLGLRRRRDSRRGGRS